MDKIELLRKKVYFKGKTYCPRIYLNGWNNWCITYSFVFNSKEYLCSVTIEPNNIPLKIEDTLSSSINSGIGNARTFDEAVDMINDYINKLIKEENNE